MIITVTNNKGGVAKTTTATALAAALANLEPTLLIDGDSQGHISLSFGLPVRSGLFDWLVRGLPLVDCTLTGRPEQLTILPGDSLTKTVERLFGDTTEFHRLVERLRALPHPFVVIDTAAGGLFQEAALAAADQVVIPFLAATRSIDSMFQTLELVRQLNPAAKLTLLPTLFDMRLKEQRECLSMVVKQFGEDYGLSHERGDFCVPARTAVSEADRAGQTIWEYGGRNSGIVDVRRAYTYLVGRVLMLAGIIYPLVRAEELINGNRN